jgi:hypothetical protein
MWVAAGLAAWASANWSAGIPKYQSPWIAESNSPALEGDFGVPLEHLPFGPRVTIHRLASAPGAGVVAVRPDGYVGFRCGTAEVGQLRAWLARIGAVQPPGASVPPPQRP